MYLRKYCNTCQCNVFLWNRVNLLARAYMVQSQNICINCLDSKNKQQFECLNISRKLEVSIFSKLQLHTSQGLQNRSDGERSKKSTSNEAGGEKQVKDQNTSQNKSTTAARNIKSTTNPKTQQKMFSLRNKKSRIVAILLGITGVYYYSHLVVDPITKRRKFNLFSERQTKTLGQIQSDHYKRKYKDRIETSGNNYNRVLKIVTTLIQANSDLPGTNEERSWTIYIIDNDQSVNSVVLANGDVFVSSGLLQAVDNDDQLAAALAHEIAHVLLNHSAEIPTWKRMFLSVGLHPVLTAYGILPRFFGALISPFLNKLSIITMKRPMGKKLEDEADTLSIDIISKACYDPRKVKEFWMAMGVLWKKRSVKLLSAHPNHKTRYHQFDSLMPKAFNILHKHCSGNVHPYFR